MPTQENLSTSTTVWRQGTPVVVDDGHRALLRRLVHYAGGKAEPGTVVLDDGGGGAATGDGTIQDLDGGVDAPAETWTIAFTSATDFDVTGSVSGAQPSGTVDTNYTTSGDPRTSLISFRINQGGTNFAAGDTFSFSTSAPPLSSASEQWILDRWSPFTTAGDGFNAIDDRASTGTTGALIWHGQGDGTEAIHAGISPNEDVGSQIWEWLLRGYTGFASSQSWNSNLGNSGVKHTAFWDNDITYWFVVNARRIVTVAVVSTTMRSCYFGLLLPFASPNEYPFPMAVIAESNSAVSHTSNAGGVSHGIWTGEASQGQIRLVDGAWLNNDLGNGWIGWPETNRLNGNPGDWWANHRLNSNDDNYLFSIAYINLASGSHVLGVPEGCFGVTGVNITPQTVLTIGGDDYLVVNNVFRTGKDDFWALRLV